MNVKKLISLLLIAIVLLSTTSFASDVVIDEKWGKPTFVYGAGLNDQQMLETARLLGINNLETVNAIRIMAADMKRYIGGDPVDSALFSSAVVTKRPTGDGMRITILTPDNITQITPEMYHNAAITAGVMDAEIDIASIMAVTGESALTGIYKAFEANGEILDPERMQVGQEELETVNKINQENATTEGFDPDKFNQVIIEIKQQLADLKERTDQLATREDIERIIREALEKYNLQNVITTTQINNLLLFFERYQQAGILDIAGVKSQLDQLSDQVSDKVKDLVEQAQASGIMEQISRFFRDLFEAIGEFFRNLG